MLMMDESTNELVECFVTGTCESFSHEEHVHVAWLLLHEHSLTAAIDMFRSGARKLAESRGRPEVYHETLTWIYMILINERIQRSESDDWESFKLENADLLEAGNAILRKYYDQRTLDSDLARRVFVLPDVAQ